jgi:hypothetical protein
MTFVLGLIRVMIDSFKRAIALLPPELTTSKRMSKKQYQEGITLAQETHDKLLQQAQESNEHSVPASGVRLDWDMLPWNQV